MAASMNDPPEGIFHHDIPQNLEFIDEAIV
jgi:hypothetical protein